MKIFRFLVLALVFYSCNDENVNPTISTRYLKIFGNISDGSSQIVNVSVVINDRIMSYSDSLGNYSIDSLMSGSYSIKFQHEKIISLDTTIVITSNKKLDIILNRLYNNYFPVDIDSFYSFDYKRTFHFSGQYPHYEKGNLQWIVSEKEKIDSGFKFQINELFNGVKLTPKIINEDEDYYYDTTYINKNSEMFITQIEDTLFFEHLTTPYSHLNGLKINHIKNNFEEIVEEVSINRKYTLKINNGIKWFYSKSVGGNNWDELEIRAIK